MRSDVVIVGYRLNAKEPAAKALERILGLGPEDARKLARGFPAVVARAVTLERAEALAEQLKAAGAQVDVREHVELSVASAALPRAAAEGGSRSAPLPTSARDARPEEPPLAERAERTERAERAEPFFPAATVAASPAAYAPDVENSYRLGDFGLGQPAPSNAQVVVPTAPARAPGEDISLDLELASGSSLELDAPAPSRSQQGATALAGAGSDLHTLGGEFEDFESVQHVPQVEERAARAIQRAPRAAEVRRSAPPSLTARARSVVAKTFGAWVSGLLLLSALSAATLFAVGYALDPGDALGALQRERALLARGERNDRELEPRPPTSPAARDARTALHPLLRGAPASVRGPLAAILRARIAGVHQVPVSFTLKSGATVDCLLVEQADASAAERSAAVRETGSPIEPPADVAAQLREHSRALQQQLEQGRTLGALCLTP